MSAVEPSIVTSARSAIARSSVNRMDQHISSDQLRVAGDAGAMMRDVSVTVARTPIRCSRPLGVTLRGSRVHQRVDPRDHLGAHVRDELLGLFIEPVEERAISAAKRQPADALDPA